MGSLKSKYFIVAIRFIELSLCVISITSFINVAKNSGVGFVFCAKKFLDYNYYFSMICLVLYLIGRICNVHILSYGELYRLNSFYVEGGPYGLFISTLLVFELYLFRRFSRLAIFSIALFFSYSKAGYILFFIGAFIWFFLMFKQTKAFLEPKNRVRFSIFTIIFLVLSLVGVGLIAKNYVAGYCKHRKLD